MGSNGDREAGRMHGTRTLGSPWALSVGLGRSGALTIHLAPLLAVAALAGVVFIPALGTVGALVFLAAGCLLCAMNPGRIRARALRDWPVVAVALFSALSFTWSREPALSLRFGVQLAATVVIALAIADRLAPRVFCLATGGLLGIAMAASVLLGGTSGGTAAWTGIYGSKNAFAGAAALFSTVAFGLALARGNGALRLAAAVAALAAFGLVVLAQSVGALVLLSISLALTALLLAAARLGPGALMAGLAASFLVALLTGLVASAHAAELRAALLDATGKDLTLTGRTELWTAALGYISDRPLLGVGFQAYWVPGNAGAEALWHMFGIEARSGFNFHNMYLSNAVEIGLIGVLLQSIVLFGAAWLTLRWTLRTASPIAAVFFATTLTVVMGSLIEVPLFFQFSLRTVLVVAAFAYARDALRGV